MKRFYKVIVLDTAKQDIINLTHVIRFEYRSPLTSVKYLRGLYKEINKLSLIAELLSIQKHKYFVQYGFNVRRLKYKKMTIIYTVIDNTAFIQRVVPSSIITD